jgi:hypothetical protein
MHAAAFGKEDAAFRWNDAVTIDEVLETGKPALAGMASLKRLRKLHRVADEDDVMRAAAHRENIGQGDLSGLIDEEVVEGRRVIAREMPGGGTYDVRSPDLGRIIFGDGNDRRMVVGILGIGDLLDDRTDERLVFRPFRDRFEKIPDGLVAV